MVRWLAHAEARVVLRRRGAGLRLGDGPMRVRAFRQSNGRICLLLRLPYWHYHGHTSCLPGKQEGRVLQRTILTRPGTLSSGLRQVYSSTGTIVHLSVAQQQYYRGDLVLRETQETYSLPRIYTGALLLTL